MQLAVTFRHMDATEALKEYSRDKVDRIRKYFPDPIKAHVVLACENGFNHRADVVITLHNGIVIKGEETTEDMYSSIDLVMAKIERQVRRYKEKIRHHKGNESIHGMREVVHRVVAVEERVEQAEDPKIIRESKFVAQPMTTKEAVMHMNLQHQTFLVFMNAASQEVNVIYRREDGTYGLIETGGAQARA